MGSTCLMMMLPFTKFRKKKEKMLLQHQEINIIEYVTGSWGVTLTVVTAAYQHHFHVTLWWVMILLKTPYSYLHFHTAVLVRVNRGRCYVQWKVKFFFPLPPPQEHSTLSRNACVSFWGLLLLNWGCCLISKVVCCLTISHWKPNFELFAVGEVDPWHWAALTEQVFPFSLELVSTI